MTYLHRIYLVLAAQADISYLTPLIIRKKSDFWAFFSATVRFSDTGVRTMSEFEISDFISTPRWISRLLLKTASLYHFSKSEKTTLHRQTDIHTNILILLIYRLGLRPSLPRFARLPPAFGRRRPRFARYAGRYRACRTSQASETHSCLRPSQSSLRSSLGGFSAPRFARELYKLINYAWGYLTLSVLYHYVQ